MQVFKIYFKILKKQLTAIIIYCVIFITITLLSTHYLIADNTEEFTMKKVSVVLVNHDGDSEFIKGLLSYMEQYVTFVDLPDNEEARSDALFFRQVSYILTIPKQFTENFIKGLDANLTEQIAPDSIEAISVDNAINNYLNTARIYIKYHPGMTEEEINNYVNKNMIQDTVAKIEQEEKDNDIKRELYNKNYFNYSAYVLIASFIIGVSTVMITFHNIDIRRRQIVTPISNRRMNFELILSNLVFVMIYLGVFIAVGYISNSYRSINANTILYWLNAVAFAIAALSISYLIGITVKSKKSVQAIATSFSLGFAFISGVFVPQEFLGAPVLKVASFLPSYWFVRANNDISELTNYNWKDISQIFGFMIIELGFGAAILSVSLVVNKRKRQQTN
ncbi:MAG: hypothetical protein K0S47_3817 [Herbinix sp.]|jgi:ABC-2 type transport system permease protein|nr:hypothetical protein [Herbinix sp.]